MNRGISILLRDARKALRKGSSGHSAAGLGSSPLTSFPFRQVKGAGQYRLLQVMAA